jgi:CRP-like cAMP-binding protein
MNLPELLVVVFFLLQTVSVALRDVLWMRVLLALSSVSAITAWILSSTGSSMGGLFFWLPTHVIWWLWIMLAINIIQLAILVRERRSLQWSNEEVEVRNTVFKQMSARSFRTLMRAGRWRTLKAESVLVVEGKPVTHLTLLVSGSAVVQVHGKTIAFLGHGAFVGEMSLLTGSPASATVRISQTSRVLVWEANALRNLMNRNQDIDAALQEALSADLLGKLSTSLPSNNTTHSMTRSTL